MTAENMGKNLPRVLVVDDEKAIQRLLKNALSSAEFSVEIAGNGGEGLQAAIAFRPDLIILDLGLPDMDGVEVLRRLREWTQVPVIILSVRDREDEKVTALDSGADDYVTKPFGVGELLARMRVALRKSLQPSPEPVYRVDGLEVDLEHRRVAVQGKEVQLTPTEYDLLRLLVSHAGKVLTHNQILRQIWGPAYVGQPHLLQVNISNLRRKIEPEPTRPRYILTELGVGYRLKANP
ncbi:MAG: response regulator transcription factor [Deltaproteobacteria bacterium]|nr:response regulator transcription factor [Deltaproteobacteria bacterium]